MKRSRHSFPARYPRRVVFSQPRWAATTTTAATTGVIIVTMTAIAIASATRLGIVTATVDATATATATGAAVVEDEITTGEEEQGETTRETGAIEVERGRDRGKERGAETAEEEETMGDGMTADAMTRIDAETTTVVGPFPHRPRRRKQRCVAYVISSQIPLVRDPAPFVFWGVGGLCNPSYSFRSFTQDGKKTSRPAKLRGHPDPTSSAEGSCATPRLS